MLRGSTHPQRKPGERGTRTVQRASLECGEFSPLFIWPRRLRDTRDVARLHLPQEAARPLASSQNLTVYQCFRGLAAQRPRISIFTNVLQQEANSCKTQLLSMFQRRVLLQSPVISIFTNVLHQEADSCKTQLLSLF